MQKGNMPEIDHGHLEFGACNGHNKQVTKSNVTSSNEITSKANFCIIFGTVFSSMRNNWFFSCPWVNMSLAVFSLSLKISSNHPRGLISLWPQLINFLLVFSRAKSSFLFTAALHTMQDNETAWSIVRPISHFKLYQKSPLTFKIRVKLCTLPRVSSGFKKVSRNWPQKHKFPTRQDKNDKPW